MGAMTKWSLGKSTSTFKWPAVDDHVGVGGAADGQGGGGGGAIYTDCGNIK